MKKHQSSSFAFFLAGASLSWSAAALSGQAPQASDPLVAANAAVANAPGGCMPRPFSALRDKDPSSKAQAVAVGGQCGPKSSAAAVAWTSPTGAGAVSGPDFLLVKSVKWTASGVIVTAFKKGSANPEPESFFLRAADGRLIADAPAAAAALTAKVSDPRQKSANITRKSHKTKATSQNNRPPSGSRGSESPAKASVEELGGLLPAVL